MCVATQPSESKRGFSHRSPAWSQGSPQGYHQEQVSDILDTMTAQGHSRYSILMDSESRLWGVWSAPITVVTVLRTRSNLDEVDAVQRLNRVAQVLQLHHGSREVGYNMNPEFDENEEYVMASGWESMQARFLFVFSERQSG